MKIAALAAFAVLGLAGIRAGAAGPSEAPPALPLTLSGNGPYYTLDIDFQARRLSAAADLGDLRVRNGAGETMAFAWVESPPPAPAPRRVPARLYKVPAPPASASAAADAPRQSWIVDTGDAGDDLLRLDLALEGGTQGIYALRIESSDDLQRWRTLREDAQLVQLQPLPQVGAAGALAPLARRDPLSADGIDLDGVPARYLRLTTAVRSAIPPLVSAAVARTRRRAAPSPLEWSETIAPASCEPTSCDYRLPPNTPVAAVQVLPADVDTIAEVMVLGRVDADRRATAHRSLLRGSLHALRLKARHAAEPAGFAWQPGATASVYWLSQASGAPDLHSPPVRVAAGPWQALRLQTFGPISQLGHVAPAIRIGVRQRQLVFVARGAGPYVLVRAQPGERSAPMSLAALMPAAGAAPAPPAASATITPSATPGPAASAPSSTEPPTAAPATHTSWLWAVLLAGLALMGAAAWSLLRRASAAATPDGR